MKKRHARGIAKKLRLEKLHHQCEKQPLAKFNCDHHHHQIQISRKAKNHLVRGRHTALTKKAEARALSSRAILDGRRVSRGFVYVFSLKTRADVAYVTEKKGSSEL